MVTTVWGQEKMHPLSTLTGKKSQKLLQAWGNCKLCQGSWKINPFVDRDQKHFEHWSVMKPPLALLPDSEKKVSYRHRVTWSHPISSPLVSEASIPDSSKLWSVVFQRMETAKMSILWDACVISHSGHSPRQMRKRYAENENPQMQNKLQLLSQSKHFTGWILACLHTTTQFKGTFS